MDGVNGGKVQMTEPSVEQPHRELYLVRPDEDVRVVSAEASERVATEQSCAPQ